MTTKVLAIVFALATFGFVGIFLWGVARPPAPDPVSAEGAAPTAAVSGQVAEGLLDLQVYLLRDLGVDVAIQFAPDVRQPAAATPPELSLAMVGMNMGTIVPPLESTGPGQWRARVTLPMAGRWAARAGFGADRAEVEFDAR